jgi:hypothetical protein
MNKSYSTVLELSFTSWRRVMNAARAFPHIQKNLVHFGAINEATYSAIYLDRRFVVPQIAQRTCAAKTIQSPGDAIDAVTKNAPFAFGGRQYRAAFRR